MRVKAGILAITLAALGGTACVAKDFSYCPMMTSTHGGENGWRDLGNGYVSYYQFGFGMVPPPMPRGLELTVEQCAKGRKIDSQVYSCSDYDFDKDKCRDKNGGFDAQTQAEALLFEESDPSDTSTFEELAKKLVTTGAHTEVHDIAEYEGESCGCYVAYPSLRGTKTKYEYWSAY